VCDQAVHVCTVVSAYHDETSTFSYFGGLRLNLGIIYARLNSCLLICRLLIFDSRVVRGIPNCCATFGPRSFGARRLGQGG
jgi:hypothetical protein